MYNRNEQKKSSNDRGNKICWVAAILVGIGRKGETNKILI
jgi:hypothetical protein